MENERLNKINEFSRKQKRLDNFDNLQVKEYKGYRPGSSNIVDKEFDIIREDIKNSKEHPDYLKRVEGLINCALRYPRADDNKDFSSLIDRFNIPEGTHPRTEYIDKKPNEEGQEDGIEIWSKDIDKNNRIMYRVYDRNKTIFFISIRGHNLTEAKKDTKLQSDIASLDYLLDPYSQREDFNYTRQKNK